MNELPTIEAIRAAVQAVTNAGYTVSVTEASHSINGPVYAVAFAAVEVEAAPEAPAPAV